MPAQVGGYELVQRIAVGGMAEVFLARRPGPEGFEKRVAVKRILPHLSAQPDFVRMFLDEARLAARLEHPHIVQIFDFGLDHDSYYLAMEFVAGEDVQAMIRRGNELALPISFVDAATILVAGCEALHHAHEQGVIHRDVTPANLLVSYDGVVKLADFGIAKADARAVHTQSGALKGKVPYMSPEQAAGRVVDRRSDVYSLGICAWELLTGRRLFIRESDLDTLAAVQRGDVRPLSQFRAKVPEALERTIMCALSFDPDDRWPTAQAFGDALNEWLGDLGSVPSKARLSMYMGTLFGTDAAAERVRVFDTHQEKTAASPSATPVPQITPQTSPTDSAPLLLHLHLPPLQLPRRRLLLPILAILLSTIGLLLALRSAPQQAAPVPAVNTSAVAPPAR